ncbi:hypothetical protein ACSC77_004028 [Escherichia coli]|jgi:hypothetical protein|uniref:hypothetical protein n=1 Tax=Enterobacteriaceae TaxID=543 RepID=UPI0002A383F5|nr:MULTISPECIES: hypothetical protein [Enterobacteriaceae]EAA4569789.1 hypothetical protein [Salmonella enterica subsp. enterica serovar Poona]EBH3538239.1 hypothetical protein [Salmonella enterica subsp. enterica serovar Enteritidis]EBX2096244.1 hypothetical protein [Salmonella enterica subsp. enterica serovar Coeln]ECC8725374.1 hypothetical protein [Salmonella enterica subsp. enterica]EGA7749193.1 hypothetical protein [Salmonella enterica]ELA7763792.1 hypothetical protein [Proteus mirabilis
MARLPYIESTTQQIFIFNTLTLCTIGLIHIETGKKYIVVFTDNNKIRDYKNGVIEELGEITQEDIELIEYYAKKYEKYFDDLKIGEEPLNLKEYIECMQ